MSNNRLLTVVPALILGLTLFACGGGGGGGTAAPPKGGNQNTGGGSTQQKNPISLRIVVDNAQGPARMVNLSAVASGGTEPYTYQWDFTDDGTIDSNDPAPFHYYNVTSICRLVVTDHQGFTKEALISIIVNNTELPPPNAGLNVSFSMSMGSISGATTVTGNVPMTVSFHAVVSGGVQPYYYTWDFDNDGTIDSSQQNPFFTYTRVGNPISQGGITVYAFNPTLYVRDGRGTEASISHQIIVNPAQGGITVGATANPSTGQAPLVVDFDGGASGGIPPYKFKWDFGDGSIVDFGDSSNAVHTYQTSGEYRAMLTVKDSQQMVATSGTLIVKAVDHQTLGVTITTDVTNAAVPFNSHFTSFPTGGKSPYSYQWVVQGVDANGNLIPLASDAIVTPSTSLDPNPTIHFANIVGGMRAIFLVVTDALGSQSTSNIILVTPQATTFNYFAARPAVLNSGPYVTNPQPFFAPRVNAAVASHLSGDVFVFGGETYDENGNYQGPIDAVQGAWALSMIPTNVNKYDGTFQDNNPFTKSPGITYTGGGWIQLNTFAGPPFPDGAYGGYYGRADAQPTQRSQDFIPRGAAAAVLIHEPVETNPVGAYPVGQPGYVVPDGPGTFQQIGQVEYGATGPPAPLGFDVPVFYVIGGRNSKDGALTTVQKYYPFGYGTEDLPMDDVDYNFQVTNNQVDIWTNRFIFPDQDQYPQQGSNINPPIIQTRPPGAGGGGQTAPDLTQLPVAVYGLQAVAVESSTTIGGVTFPYGPFEYIFTLGGRESDGSVSRDFRFFDTRQAPSAQTSTDPRRPNFGYFSLVTDDGGVEQPMPVGRYFFKAVLQPAYLPLGLPFKIYVFGGFDQNNRFVQQVDVFTFTNSLNPVTGTWQANVAQLPLAKAGNEGGFEVSVGGSPLIQVFSGIDVNRITGTIYTMENSVFTVSPMPLIPRYNLNGASVYQGSATTIGYVEVGGFDGHNNLADVEVFRVP
jgi:PKD repeat protein